MRAAHQLRIIRHVLNLARNQTREVHMTERITHHLLNLLAGGIVKAGAKVAPLRELDVFPTRIYAKGCKWWHLDAYLAAPGWLMLAVGGWTVEVSWKMQQKAAVA